MKSFIGTNLRIVSIQKMSIQVFNKWKNIKYEIMKKIDSQNIKINKNN